MKRRKEVGLISSVRFFFSSKQPEEIFTGPSLILNVTLLQTVIKHISGK